MRQRGDNHLFQLFKEFQQRTLEKGFTATRPLPLFRNNKMLVDRDTMHKIEI